MNSVQSYLSDFISLVFPDICPGCGDSLVKNEEVLCTGCLHGLPYTHFHLDADNNTAKHLWGKVPVEAAASLLYFRKGGTVQHLLHLLKYQNQTVIGSFLGRLYGQKLNQADRFKEIDCICPVPLHKKRLRQRGYNQSEFFAVGLAEAMGKPINANSLLRVTPTGTQTKRSRYDRHLNTKGVFCLKEPEALNGKHVLLVDDVITTGSTLCACADCLLTVPDVKISIATIAYVV